MQIIARSQKQNKVINWSVCMFESPTDSRRAHAGSFKAVALGFFAHLIGFASYGLANEDLTLFDQRERFILYSMILAIAFRVIAWVARKHRKNLIEIIGYELPKDVAIVAPISQSSKDSKVRDLGLRYWRSQLAMHFMVGSWAFWIGALFFFFFIKKAA